MIDLLTLQSAETKSQPWLSPPHSSNRLTRTIQHPYVSSEMRAGDAIIAATATENGMQLSTGNAKHFKPIKELELKVFNLHQR